jgi:enamine deaminase RidA (YjgF/YER057c/UK114 family)
MMTVLTRWEEMMPTADERLIELGLTLPAVSKPLFNYVSHVRTGDLVYVAGHVSRNEDDSILAGKLGDTMTTEQGYDAARTVALGILATLKSAVGDFDNVVRIVRLFGMVNCTSDFAQQPQVINGASDLLVDVLGERGKHARAAIGMVALPLGAAVEIEAVVEVRD